MVPGSFKYLYNVQPKGGRKESGPSSKTKFHYTDEWTLAEWSVDNATQSYELENLTASGGRAGRASGDYRVRRAGRSSIEGSIVLGVERDRGVTRIALIAVTPRT